MFVKRADNPNGVIIVPRPPIVMVLNPIPGWAMISVLRPRLEASPNWLLPVSVRFAPVPTKTNLAPLFATFDEFPELVSQISALMLRLAPEASVGLCGLLLGEELSHNK